MTALRIIAVTGCSVAAGLAGLRWLRVAQREHYLPGSALRFAGRWWEAPALNAGALVLAVAGAVLAGRWPATALATGAVVAAGPLGLGLRGRTSPLAWTRRAKTLAVVGLGLLGGALALCVLFGVGPPGAAALALAVPLLVDGAAAITGPFERAAAHRHVRRAAQRLRRVAPTVVAITGSYGKTSTKGYVAHLLAGSRAVVASPASFNNRAGLARAVNEQLLDGTDVFVAEMGTYGPGEIADLCSWLVPDVAVITAIGPVHLERFGTEDRIVAAKAEILQQAPAVVLNVGDPRLAALATESEILGRRVRRVAALGSPDDPGPGGASVTVAEDDDGLALMVDGVEVAHLAPGPRPGNLACAVAVALELGVPVEEIAGRLAGLPVAPHRLQSATADGGVVVLDDTYNANPAGARVALQALSRAGSATGRRVVVTPGMVELGPRQDEENTAFAAAAAAVADDLVVVGRTNRRALLAGALRGPVRPASDRAGDRPPLLHSVVVADRPEAVSWVRRHLGPGDAVLYENDLPDHYP
jgi:UDP-N-acetylmuramoyl-tripeptide--D-alanyl-D-alanine ligase